MKLTHLISGIAALSMILMNFGARPAQAAPVKITLWHIATGDDPFHPILQGAIDRFNASHSDVRFDAKAIKNEDFKNQLPAAISDNTQPDVFQTWGGGLLQSFEEAGVVRDIPELNSDAGKKFAPGALAPSTFNGKHYAIPANLAGVFLWYNEDLFKSHNVQLPTTWSQFIAACQTFKAAGIIPVALGNKDKWPGGFWMDYLVSRIGGPDAFMKAFSRAPGSSFADPVFVQAGAKIQEAARAGCFEDNPDAMNYGDTQPLVGKGQVAMQLQGDWNLGGLKQANNDLTQRSIKVLPFPAVEGGSGDPKVIVGGTGQAFAISAKAPAETAGALIELLSSPEFGSAVAAGGFIPALVGYDQQIQDPITRQMAKMLAETPYVQLYYDQFLPPALSQAHLDTTQQLINLSISPEDAAQKMEAAASSELGNGGEQFTGSSLRTLAQARGIYVGAAVAITPLRYEPRYTEALKREFNMITAENAMKIAAIRPNRQTFNFKDADAILSFAQANQMQVRGHTLVWHKDLPGWLTGGNFSRDELMIILKEHIQTVVGHYKGRILAWDVVNEAVDENGAPRDSLWRRVIGPDYIEMAFRWAHEADPQALLFYNDYGGEGLGPKSDAIYGLAQDLVKRGVPINGVGLQMHVTLGKAPKPEDVKANIERLSALDLQIHITELDVDIRDGTGTTAQRLAAQANVYRDVANVCLGSPACKALVMWGFTDRYTWIGNMPLPFDKSYRPKPAYVALVEAFTRT